MEPIGSPMQLSYVVRPSEVISSPLASYKKLSSKIDGIRKSLHGSPILLFLIFSSKILSVKSNVCATLTLLGSR
jgi:hypothetical protein